jgi:hypothetical protein
MRRAVPLCLLLALLGGCEKSFDDRYAQAQKKLGEQAVSIDRELAAKASEASLAPEAMPAATALPTSAAKR